MKRVMYGHRGWLLINVLNMAAVAALNGSSIYLLRFITDYGLNRELDKMLVTAQWMMAILFGALILNGLGTLLKSIYMEKSLILMKNTYIHHLMNQDITQLQKEKSNIYRSNLTNDFDRFEEKFLLNALKMATMALQFAMAVVLVATVSWYLVIVAFIMLVIFVNITSRTSKPVEKTEAKKSQSLQDYTDFVQETLNGFEIIKQHQLEASRLDQFIDKATKVQKDNYAVDVKTTQVEALNQFIQIVIIFSLIISGILFAKNTNISLGSIIVVASSFGNVMWPLQQFSPIITQMKGISKVIEDFDANLRRPIINRHIHVRSFEQLAFNNCDLGYEDEDRSILNDINFAVHKGEKILIVGRSGAGKSTVLKTIRQSIKPKEGLVMLDGHDIYDIVPIDYYSLFTTIDQIGFIFNGTIKENVTLYQPITDIKIKKALDQVGLSSFDLDQVLYNNGSNISGGQRARLMLARALCLDSDVILCDEIFSSLELSIAQQIEKDMLRLGKTIINVSHIIFKEHLSQYDRIYIVENNTMRLAHHSAEVWDRMTLSETAEDDLLIAV
jgi:ATP-binding cassette subfamily B protein